MPAMDYYLVLGVPRDANLPQIKRAYRTLAHQYHPDHAGESGHERFQQIKEAYDTLSNSARRADHNRELTAQGAVESPSLHRHAPLSIFDAFASYQPSFDEIYQRYLRNFTHAHVPKSEPVRALTIEVHLTADEARAGGQIPFEIPVASLCPVCQGTGRTGFFPCDACDSEGMLWRSHTINVIYPRHTADNTSVPLSLNHLGVRNLYLNVLLRVTGSGRVS